MVCWWIKLYTFTGLLLLSSLISMESNLYVLLNISESRASCYIFPYHPELLIFHWTMKKGGLQFTVLCRWSICVRKLWLFCIRISAVSVFFFFWLMKREWRGPTRHGDLLRPLYFSAVSVYLCFTLIIRLRLYSSENKWGKNGNWTVFCWIAYIIHPYFSAVSSFMLSPAANSNGSGYYMRIFLISVVRKIC